MEWNGMEANNSSRGALRFVGCISASERTAEPRTKFKEFLAGNADGGSKGRSFGKLQTVVGVFREFRDT